MNRFLFVTYGQPGWRGVQMRALRIAKYIPKDRVVFWELYDPQPIKDWGFPAETKHPGLVHPDAVIFPKDVGTVIFSDLPSNELSSYGIYQAALLQKKNVVVCDQIYRSGQTSETVFRTFAKYSSLMLYNTLSSLAAPSNGHVKFLPPQIEARLQPSIVKEMRQKHGIPLDKPMIYASAYNAGVREKVISMAREMNRRKINFCLVVSGDTEITATRNVIPLPSVTGEEYFKLIYSADLVLAKFGYLQIIEALALGKPVVVMGEAGQLLQNPKALDRKIRKNLFFDTEPDINETVARLLINRKFYTQVSNTINKIHDGSFFGARQAARLIMELPQTPVKLPESRRLSIMVNEEYITMKEWLLKHPGVYPLIFVLPSGTRQEIVKRIPPSIPELPVSVFQERQPDELLPHSFRHLFVMSQRKFDGLTDVFPWFATWVTEIERLLLRADTIYLSPKAERIVGGLIAANNLKSKVRKLAVNRQQSAPHQRGDMAGRRHNPV